MTPGRVARAGSGPGHVHASRDPKTWRVPGVVRSDLLLDETLQQRAMTRRLVRARGRAQERERLAAAHAARERFDERFARLHLVEVARDVLVVPDRVLPVLAVERCVQLDAGSELLPP